MSLLHIIGVWFSVFGGLLFQEKYSSRWDNELNELITNAKEVKVGPHTTEINGVNLWTSNKYYSYGYKWGWKSESFRPSIKTMLRLNQFINLHKNKENK